MSQFSLTSLIYNAPYAKQLGLPSYYYRWRKCNTNLTGSTPADQYQKLKQIQNTIRVYGSLYTANLAPLTAYTQPISDPTNHLYGVCWNQMSDRPVPSVQKATIPTGYNTLTNRKHTSVTSSKPGSQTPGGIGCDIKHNSYDRYLNRIKGKGPLRRGYIPNNYGNPIKFNPAYPIYGGKTIKTNIVNGCNCPIPTNSDKLQDNYKLYNNPLWQPYPSSNYSFQVGDYVYAVQTGHKIYTKAVVISINNDVYTIRFDNGIIQDVFNVNELLIYYPCNCQPASQQSVTFKSALITSSGVNYGNQCILPINAVYTY